MRRPKWLNEWGVGKNPIKGELTIDTPDIKVAEVSLNNNLVLVAIGARTRRETFIQEQEINLEWKLFYDSTVMPCAMSKEKLKDLLAGLVYALSRDSSIYDEETKYIAYGDRPMKGHAPVLVDYEMLKRIEAARNQKDH